MNGNVQPFVNDESEVRVSGFLHEPARPSGEAIVLTHGAGGNCQSPLLVALGSRFSADGITVLRFDLPFRQKRPHGPPSPASAGKDQEGIKRAVEVIRARGVERIYAGGQSYGGRQISMVAAEDNEFADALLLLSYPLHPPGRPNQLRTGHFVNLRVPSLFVTGTNDPFAGADELERALALIPGRKHFVAVPGSGHSLLTAKNRGTLPETIAREFERFRSVPR